MATSGSNKLSGFELMEGSEPSDLQHGANASSNRSFRVKFEDFRFILGAVAGTDQFQPRELVKFPEAMQPPNQSRDPSKLGGGLQNRPHPGVGTAG